MKHSMKQVQGIEALPGWTIGRAPLHMRGIRFANETGNEGGAQPPAPAAPAPAPAPAPPAPPAPAQPANTYSADYVRDLRGEAKGHREGKEAAEKSVAELQAKYDKDLAELGALRDAHAATARASAIRSAADGVADVDSLLDSQAFANATKGVDLGDAAAAKAAVAEFVEANPRFAAAPAPGRAAARQQGAPSGSGAPAGAPTSLKGALNAHFANL